MARVLILTLLLLTSPALAQQPQYVLRCNGAPFQSNTSHERLVKFFGAKNVTVTEDKKTVLFANDPTRRLEIIWLDDGGKTCPINILVSGEKNRWIGPFGIKTGMTIQQIEQLNGKPFTVSSYGDNIEASADFKDSRLHRVTPRCSVSAEFAFAGSISPEFRKRLTSNDRGPSKDPELLLLKPRLKGYSISYPPEC